MRVSPSRRGHGHERTGARGSRSEPALGETADGVGNFSANPVQLAALYRASLHTFDVIRSGAAVSDAATGIVYSASHMDDALLDRAGGPHRDLTGGWYNAGDFGKWTMHTAITVSYLLKLYQLQERAGRRGDPALLREAEWGLAWMLKMQDADGGVRHKVDSGTHFVWGLSPQSDPNVRFATGAATLDTADFAAVMYEAARVSAAERRDGGGQRVWGEPVRYRAAADRAWAWLAQHTEVPARDPFYANDDPTDEIVWARCERLLSRPDSRWQQDLAGNLARDMVKSVDWTNPGLLGVFDVAWERRGRDPVGAAARLGIHRAAEQVLGMTETNAFHVAATRENYVWGTVEWILHRGALLAMADALQSQPRLEEAALAQMRFVLGNNALGHSFVVGFGRNPVQHPDHWTMMALGKQLPGWAVFGPNGSPEGADEPLKALQRRGTPPELCYLDLCAKDGSWASN